MKKIYGTYRMKYTNTGVRYSPSYFLNKQYEDYLTAGLTDIHDMDIGDEQYTAELVPGLKKMTRFFTGEYNEKVIDPQIFMSNIMKVGAEFGIQPFATVDEAKSWLRANTSLKEESEGKFILNDAYTDIISNEQFPIRYLVID